MKIGWIGTGSLGKAMLKRLIDQGINPLTWNRSISKLKDIDVDKVGSPQEVVKNCEITAICLYDSTSVKEILKNISEYLHDKIIVDFTTNSSEAVIAFHRLVSEAGGYYLESPVIGSVVPASRGELTILISGKKDPFEKAKFLFNLLGKRLFFFQEPGKATRLKLINNMVLGGFTAILSEAIAIGEKAGFSKDEIIEILESGAGQSLVLSAKKNKILNEDFSVHFSTKNMLKDLDYLSELARRIEKPAPIISVIKEFYRSAYRTDPEKDMLLILQILRKL